MMTRAPVADAAMAEVEAVILQARARARPRRRIAVALLLIVIVWSIAAAFLVVGALNNGSHSASGGSAGSRDRPGSAIGYIAGCGGALQYPIRLPRLGGTVMVMRGRLRFEHVHWRIFRVV